MKIECILKRENGTVAEVGGVDYHFAPQADGAHVAEVENCEHIERFLAIPEGYRIYRETAVEAKEEPKAERKSRKKPEQAVEEPQAEA